MKKLRMIVTSVMVLAIVSSSLAFTAKKLGSYCKSANNTANQQCTVVRNYFIETPGANNTFYKANWNGLASDCTTTCGDAIRLVTPD